MMILASIAAISASLPSAPHEAVFDGAQSGSMRPLRVDRPLAGRSADGQIAYADEPRWGPTRVVGDMPDWEHTWACQGSIRVLIGGVCQDDRTPLLLAINSMTLELTFFAGAFEGEPLFEWSLQRIDETGEHMDLLANHPLRRENEAFAVRSGCALPGCVLLHCERSRLIDGAWVSEGISVFALQQRMAGWELEHVYDGPPLADASSGLGWGRGWISSMQNYFPVPSDGPMTEAFVPFVDYINHQAGQYARGGQCFLLKAVRDDVTDAPWRFEGPVLLHEFSGTDRQHAHAAAWTPNGVLLAVGDGENSDVRVLSCEDWSDWTNLDQWTLHTRMHGLTDPDGGPGLAANQFWAAAPGPTPNEVIVGGDNVSTAIMSVQVPENPDAGVAFERLWGRQFGDPSDDGQRQTTCSSLTCVRPEHGGGVVARVNREGSAFGEEHARILYSPDRRHFGTVARMTDGAGDASPVAVVGDRLLQGRFVVQHDRGVWSMPLSADWHVGRGVLIEPGSVDLLRVEGAAAVLEAGAGTEVEIVDRSAGDLAAIAAMAPGVGEVWHITREESVDSTIAVLELPWVATPCEVEPVLARTWICNLAPGVLSIEQRMRADAEYTSRRAKLVTQGEWIPAAIMTDAGDFLQGNCPRIELRTTGANEDVGPLEFLVTIDGLFQSEFGQWTPALPDDPADLPEEQFSLPLRDLGDTWSVAIDLVLPETGIDRGVSDRLEEVPLAAIPLKGGDVLRIVLRPRFEKIRLDVVRGAEVIGRVEQGGVRVERLDTLHVAVAGGPGFVGMHARSGGSSTLEGTRFLGKAIAVSGTPSAIRFGGLDGGIPPHAAVPIEILRVSQDTVTPSIEFDFDWQGSPPLPPCVADLDGNGAVDVNDLLIFAAFWGPCEDCPADLNGNGVVGTDDLLVLLGEWGACPD
ncbi:MAG: hypothetical protein QF561_02140 [Phycisphaerales bacterium]|jgi:hypothetical protein|nr:hypothetical protein [Phycisphaerales bacterium]